MLHDILVSEDRGYRSIWKTFPALEGRMFSESIRECLPAPWNAHIEQLQHRYYTECRDVDGHQPRANRVIARAPGNSSGQCGHVGSFGYGKFRTGRSRLCPKPERNVLWPHGYNTTNASGVENPQNYPCGSTQCTNNFGRASRDLNPCGTIV